MVIHLLQAVQVPQTTLDLHWDQLVQQDPTEEQRWRPLAVCIIRAPTVNPGGPFLPVEPCSPGGPVGPYKLKAPFRLTHDNLFFSVIIIIIQ